jgi:hypothetical protein
MPLPKPVAAGICAAILGAQLWVSFPISKELRAWYWPFLPYPMYATAHERGDVLFLPQLRVATCGSPRYDKVLTAADVGVSAEQLKLALVYIARAPHAPRADRASKSLSDAIEAQHPGRYCKASAWLRVVSVSDTSTHHAYAATRFAAEWSLLDARAK